MRRSCVTAAFLIGIGILTLATSAFAQASSAIAGTVRDSSGAVLPGVTVEASSPALIERTRTAVSDEQGQYRIVGLVPGLYSVTFTLQGFSAFKRDGIDLPNNFTANVNAELRVGGIEETITVSGQSPVVDVQNAAARNQITREALDTIPTNKTLEAFAALTPGVSMAQTIGQDVGGSKGETYVQLRIHGTRTGDNKTLVDGFETNDYSGRVFVPNPASAGEVSIELGNGPGEAPANGVYVNFVPRDGGNQFHGTVFGTYTGPGFQSEPNLTDDLISRGLSQSDLGKVLRIWDANGSIGGPIVRDRLWFHHATRSWGSANAVVGAYYNLTPTAWTVRARCLAPCQRRLQQRRHHEPLHPASHAEEQVQRVLRLGVPLRLPSQCQFDACARGVGPARVLPEGARRHAGAPPATSRLLFWPAPRATGSATVRSPRTKRRSTRSASWSSRTAFVTDRSASTRPPPAPDTGRSTTSSRTRASRCRT